MLVSAEIRWFWRDEPRRLASWFTDRAAHDGIAAGGPECREDAYLRDPTQRELGVKVRGAKPGVEVKGLVAVTRPGISMPPFQGPVEIWTKWTSVSLTVPAGGSTVVQKSRRLRKFGVDSGAPLEIALDEDAGPRKGARLPDRGCNVEFTRLAVAGATPWWTLGFEAFGEPDTVVATLEETARAFAARIPPDLTDGVLASYPAWLAERAG